MSEKIDNIKIIGIFIVIVLFLYFMGIGCPIRFLLGVCCPGCGLTRAYIQLLHGNFNLAFICHPLFFLPPIVYIIYISNINYSIKNKIFLIAILFFLFLYILRLFGGIFIKNNVLFDEISKLIYIDIKKSFTYQFIKKFFINK